MRVVFIVAVTPTPNDDGTLAVPAYDASDLCHFDDSRGSDAAHFHGGVGAGALHLSVVAAGAPIGFQFGPGDPLVADTIAVARITGLRSSPSRRTSSRSTPFDEKWGT